MAAMACDRVVSDLMLPLWEKVLWPFLDAWDSVRLRTTSTQWNVPRRYGPHGELFFFLQEKEPMVLRERSLPGPSIRPHGELLFLLMQKKPSFVPDSEAFNSYIGTAFQSQSWRVNERLRKTSRQTVRAKTTLVLPRCLSSGHMDLATQLPASCKTGRWQR